MSPTPPISAGELYSKHSSLLSMFNYRETNFSLRLHGVLKGKNLPLLYSLFWFYVVRDLWWASTCNITSVASDLWRKQKCKERFWKRRGGQQYVTPFFLIFTGTNHTCRVLQPSTDRVNHQRSCSNICTYTASNKMGNDCWRLDGKTYGTGILQGMLTIPEFLSIPTAVAFRCTPIGCFGWDPLRVPLDYELGLNHYTKLFFMSVRAALFHSPVFTSNFHL